MVFWLFYHPINNMWNVKSMSHIMERDHIVVLAHSIQKLFEIHQLYVATFLKETQVFEHLYPTIQKNLPIVLKILHFEWIHFAISLFLCSLLLLCYYLFQLVYVSSLKKILWVISHRLRLFVAIVKVIYSCEVFEILVK